MSSYMITAERDYFYPDKDYMLDEDKAVVNTDSGFSLFDDWGEDLREVVAGKGSPPSPSLEAEKARQAKLQRVRAEIIEKDRQRREKWITTLQHTKELSAKVFYGILKLTYDEIQAEFEETRSRDKAIEMRDTVWAIARNFSVLVHPHANLNRQMKEEGDQKIWKTDPYKPSRLQKFSLPPIMFPLNDMIKWYPGHGNWGFESYLSGDVFIRGRLVDLVEQDCNALKQTDFIKLKNSSTL